MSASVPAPTSQIVPPARTSRPYLYWLDPLRGVTALIVILVHVLIFVDFHWRSVRAQEWQSAGIAVTHVTRNVFMFITAIRKISSRPVVDRSIRRPRGVRSARC
jgi:hypothetical protein